MVPIHISAAEAARDFAALLVKVRAGAEVVIEDGALTFAIVHTPHPAAPLKNVSPFCRKTTDEDFGRNVEEAVAAHREPLNPPVWD